MEVNGELARLQFHASTFSATASLPLSHNLLCHFAHAIRTTRNINAQIITHTY